MIKIFKYAVFAGIFLLLAGCESDPILLPEETSYVAFSKGAQTISEDAGSTEIELYYATFSHERAEFTISVSTDGIDSPANEGTDFTLVNSKVVFENGVGYAKITLNVTDNDIYEGAKQFYLVISSAPAGCKIGIDGRERILITIADDEHPLAIFKGNYDNVLSSFYGGGYSTVTEIDVNPLNPDQILIFNICLTSLSQTGPVVATVNEEEKTLTLKSKQVFTAKNVNGYMFAFNAGNTVGLPENSEPEPLDQDVVGTYTIDEESGEIIITLTNWGPKWIEPDGTTYDGWWWWNFFNSSILTKIID